MSKNSRSGVSRVNDGYQTTGTRAPNAQIQTQTVYSASVSVRQLPSPEELVKYAAVVPDMPERLLANFEKQADHRIHMETVVIEGDASRARLGLIGGWVFAMTLLLGSVYLIATGHETAGTLTFLSDVGGLGGAYVYGDWQRRKERARKSE